MVVAIIIGVIAGAVSFLPLWGGSQLIKRVTPTSNLGYGSSLLLAVLGSAVILFGSALICIFASRSNAVPFVGAEAGGIVIAALAFAVSRIVRK